MIIDDDIRPSNGYPRGPKGTWSEQARRICQGNAPYIGQQIPALLCWLEDYNWPGAHNIAHFLLSMGKPVVPHVRRILQQSEDLQWKYWLVLVFALNWPQDYVREIRDEVLSLARGGDDNEVHLIALEAAIKANMIDRTEAMRLLDEKESTYPGLREDWKELRELISSAYEQ